MWRGGVALTAPKRCYRAGYQPGPGEGEESMGKADELVDVRGL